MWSAGTGGRGRGCTRVQRSSGGAARRGNVRVIVPEVISRRGARCSAPVGLLFWSGVGLTPPDGRIKQHAVAASPDTPRQPLPQVPRPRVVPTTTAQQQSVRSRRALSGRGKERSGAPWAPRSPRSASRVPFERGEAGRQPSQQVRATRCPPRPPGAPRRVRLPRASAWVHARACFSPPAGCRALAPAQDRAIEQGSGAAGPAAPRREP
jgi:hypothetical protein